ncbi:transposase family protein [Streptomyces avermitilis]|uniref:transposase family protein n=1 Tax=Streptomyces avermitilis TaxID=33903 RepID=UPI00368BBE61
MVESIEHAAGAHSAVPGARCPRCGVVSWRVHGRYTRRLAGAPVGGAPAVVELVVRRFKCLNPQCPAVTFAEQIEGLTSPHARYPPPLLRTLLTSIAACLAGRPGARLAAALNIHVTKDKLLELLRGLPELPQVSVRVLAVPIDTWPVPPCPDRLPVRPTAAQGKPGCRWGPSIPCHEKVMSRWVRVR